MKLKHLFLTLSYVVGIFSVAFINKDGVVNNADIDRLAELILEQTNCQNNQNN